MTIKFFYVNISAELLRISGVRGDGMTVGEFFTKLLMTTIVAIVVLLPFGLYLLGRWLFVPEGFWQQITLFAVWVVGLGWLQLLLLLKGFVFVVEDIWEI